MNEQIVFTNMKVSGSMVFNSLSFENFQKLMDFIERLTGGESEAPVPAEPTEDVRDEPVVPAGMSFPDGMPVHVYERPEDMEPAGGEEKEETE